MCKSRFTLEHVVIGVLVRVEANAADGGGQEAHFLDDGDARRILDRAERQRRGRGPRCDATRGRLARALSRTLLADVRLDEPIPAREVTRELEGLTGLGELAKSRRPWVCNSGTSLSPGGDGRQASLLIPDTPPACAFLCLSLPRIVSRCSRGPGGRARICEDLFRVDLPSEPLSRTTTTTTATMAS